MLLPTEHIISKLVIKDAHNHVRHAGRERTLCETRRKYWIPRGRNLIKQVVKNCVTCRKLRQYPHTTLMADLPPERLKVFSPPVLSDRSRLIWSILPEIRSEQEEKELGSLVYMRYSTRDTLGTSFVGCESELKKLMQESKEKVEEFVMAHKVRWKFNTPLSPHQGGFFESMIKQAKKVLRVIVGEQVLTWNEMATVFAEVKCLVNSRPLGYPSNDPNDLQPITPNHFVLGRATPEIPQGPFRETKNSRKRFEFVQALVQQFWNRFHREYLQSLMRRAKWRTKERQFKVGDVVLMVDSNVTRGKWNLARVLEVYPGRDGVVRNVLLKTKSGEYKRSVQKCCPILEEDS